MKVKDEATGKEKKLDPWSKDEVDDMLKANGITIEHDKDMTLPMLQIC